MLPRRHGRRNWLDEAIEYCINASKCTAQNFPVLNFAFLALFYHSFEALSVLTRTQEFLILFGIATFTRITLSCHRPTYGVPISQCAKIKTLDHL